jgi:hypothetical protein
MHKTTTEYTNTEKHTQTMLKIGSEMLLIKVLLIFKIFKISK